MPDPAANDHSKKIYPSRRPGYVHACRAAGMKRIEFLIWPERKNKVVQYCKMKGVSMTHLLSRLVLEEISQHYDEVHSRWKRQQLQQRGKAYKYLISSRVTKPRKVK